MPIYTDFWADDYANGFQMASDGLPMAFAGSPLGSGSRRLERL